MKSVLLAVLALGSALANSQSTLESSKPLFVQDIHVSGTRSLDSNQLNEIVGPLNQLKVGGTEEIRERLRFQFQDYGFFNVEVKSLSIKNNDPLASVPPVTVQAEVVEGPRFLIGDILFTGIRALTAEELRSKFPIRPGEFFSRTKVGKGLEGLRDVYGRLGYIELYCIPDTSTSDEKVSLHIEVHEGRQFRMGALELAGNPELAEKLRVRWNLEKGKPYDATYLSKFVQENESLLPPQFDVSSSTKIARNCQEKTVTVFIELGHDRPSIKTPSDAGCEEETTTPPR